MILKVLVLILLCASASALASNMQEVWEEPGGRIPPQCILGRTFGDKPGEFRWMPGPLIILDIAEHYHVREWLNRHQDVILKYLPKVIQYAAKWNQEKNYILALIPAAMKILHKGIK